jgi:hypothetical protein
LERRRRLKKEIEKGGGVGKRKRAIISSRYG